jgi:hypothetical protein
VVAEEPKPKAKGSNIDSEFERFFGKGEGKSVPALPAEPTKFENLVPGAVFKMKDGKYDGGSTWTVVEVNGDTAKIHAKVIQMNGHVVKDVTEDVS